MGRLKLVIQCCAIGLLSHEERQIARRQAGGASFAPTKSSPPSKSLRTKRIMLPVVFFPRASYSELWPVVSDEAGSCPIVAKRKTDVIFSGTPTPSPTCCFATPTDPRSIYVLLLSFFVGIVMYLDRACISIALPSIQREFGVDKIAMGWSLSAFQWTYGALDRNRTAVFTTKTLPPLHR